jgi:glycosyltransferase involved in cell wall biosynthesis
MSNNETVSILLIHHRLPWPLNSGMDKVRFNLLVTLSKRYKVTLAVPIYENTKPEWIEKVRPYVEDLVTVPVVSNENRIKRNKLLYLLSLTRLLFFRIPGYASDNYYEAFKNRLVTLINEKQFAFVQILSDFSACYIPYLPQETYRITGPMDDTIELTSRSYQIETKKMSKLGLKFLYVAMKKYFSMICKRSDLVLFHSNEDLNRVKLVLGFDFNAGILPAVTERAKKAEEPIDDIEPNSIVFVGGFGTNFNQDAVMHLVSDILPIIRKKVPDVTLYLVGNNPPPFIIALGTNKNIIITGEVPDVRPFVRKAAVYVSSVRIGTGIKTKIIEALSMSKALVVSSASMQGLWETDDSICVSDNNNDFAEQVVAFLQNSDLRRKHEEGSAALYNRAYALSKAESLTLACYLEFEKKIPFFN